MSDIKKIILEKTINHKIYSVYPKTSSDIVTYGDETVKDALDNIKEKTSDILPVKDANQDPDSMSDGDTIMIEIETIYDDEEINNEESGGN